MEAKKTEKMRLPLPPDRRFAPKEETAPMIVNDLSHIFHGCMRAHEGEGVMSRHSARMIFRLLMQQDGLLQGEIARSLHISAPTASAVLRDMEAEGILRREENSEDKRAVRIYVTEEGRALDSHVRAQLRGLDARMMRGFDAQEIEILKTYLNRMRDNLLNPEQESEELPR